MWGLGIDKDLMGNRVFVQQEGVFWEREVTTARNLTELKSTNSKFWLKWNDLMCQNSVLHFELVFWNEKCCFVSKYRHEAKFNAHSPSQERGGELKKKLMFYHRKAFIQRKPSFLMATWSIVKIFISDNKCGQDWPELGCSWQCRCESIRDQSLLGPNMARNTTSNVSCVKGFRVCLQWDRAWFLLLFLYLKSIPPKPGRFAAGGAQGCGFICFLCNTQCTCCSDLGGNWASC